MSSQDRINTALNIVDGVDCECKESSDELCDRCFLESVLIEATQTGIRERSLSDRVRELEEDVADLKDTIHRYENLTSEHGIYDDCMDMWRKSGM